MGAECRADAADKGELLLERQMVENQRIDNYQHVNRIVSRAKIGAGSVRETGGT
jgi:hypothetical protein